MRRLVAGFVGGIVLASAGIAGAVTNGYVRLHNHEVVSYAGVACAAEGRDIVCLQNRQHYSVVYARSHVTVLHRNTPVWSG